MAGGVCGWAGGAALSGAGNRGSVGGSSRCIGCRFEGGAELGAAARGSDCAGRGPSGVAGRGSTGCAQVGSGGVGRGATWGATGVVAPGP